MRVLLTGAAGFIGSHVVEALLRRGDQVVGVDNFNEFYDPQIKRRNIRTLGVGAEGAFFVLEADITDPAAIRERCARERFDAIVHLAAWAGVRPSIRNPGIYVDVNVHGTMNLLEIAREAKIPRFVFASSSSVYGDRAEVPFRETDRVDRPVSPYAATKLAGELMCHTWHHLHGLNVTALRFFTVYGPRQRPEMAIHHFAKLIARGEPVPMFGDGSTARDYTYIDDIVKGTVAAVDRCAGYEIVNLGEEHTTTLRELISQLGAAMGTTPTIREEPAQPGDVARTFADVSKARTLLGYAPSTTMAEGLARFVEWYRREGVR